MTKRPAAGIISDAFQRQQVAQAVSPAEDGKSILIAYTVLVSLDTGTVSFFERTDNFSGGEIKEMPNAKVLSEKQAVVAALTEKLQNAAAGVIVDYKGITVAEDTTLRTQCRENNIDYAVVKNTLLRFAFNNVGLNELDDQLNGATSLAVCMDDPVAPARVIAEFAKKLNGKFEIKGGFMDGKVVSLETVNALAAIPALPVLQAQVLGTMLAPISALACVLKQIAEKQGAPAEEAAAE